LCRAWLESGIFVHPHSCVAHISDEGDNVVRRRPLNVRLFGTSLAHAARILELNRLTDFALLKMKADDRTPFLTMGDSRTVESGELLTLVRHPLGRLEWTVSAGIVDSITSLEHIFLQATLVKGQSGGPAIDEEGNVVGMASYREEGPNSLISCRSAMRSAS
jgi:S1-C subfamily serine protease